ncbi:hypothetical protein [Brasilonema sp. UFV-L1]|uniref:hypothetical protein n=1 Tax=Brasilonema sp. UFV-L1 TaxID=2234130 RepID=UPI00145D51B2|nr:hypothetical protein [Brasilonema sp. UFV-L1]
MTLTLQDEKLQKQNVELNVSSKNKSSRTAKNWSRRVGLFEPVKAPLGQDNVAPVVA